MGQGSNDQDYGFLPSHGMTTPPKRTTTNYVRYTITTVSKSKTPCRMTGGFAVELHSFGRHRRRFAFCTGSFFRSDFCFQFVHSNYFLLGLYPDLFSISIGIQRKNEPSLNRNTHILRGSFNNPACRVHTVCVQVCHFLFRYLLQLGPGYFPHFCLVGNSRTLFNTSCLAE